MKLKMAYFILGTRSKTNLNKFFNKFKDENQKLIKAQREEYYKLINKEREENATLLIF